MQPRPGVSPDDYVKRLVAGSLSLVIRCVLMACYRYHVQDDPLLSDDIFEWLVAVLKADPGLRRLHPHGLLMGDGHLEAGSGFDLK
jgi:hypothetical protein